MLAAMNLTLFFAAALLCGKETVAFTTTILSAGPVAGVDTRVRVQSGEFGGVKSSYHSLQGPSHKLVIIVASAVAFSSSSSPVSNRFRLAR